MESLNEFWLLVVDVWQNGLFGLDIGRFIISLGIFLAFMVVRGLFAKVIIANLKRLTAKSETTIDDEVADALDKPLRFVPVVASSCNT